MKQKTAPIEGGLCEKGQESIIKKLISNGNRTEWSPIRSVTIRVITKSDDRAAESDLFITSMIIQTELDDTQSYYQLIIKITISEKRKVAKLCDKGKFYL